MKKSPAVAGDFFTCEQCYLLMSFNLQGLQSS